MMTHLHGCLSPDTIDLLIETLLLESRRPIVASRQSREREKKKAHWHGTVTEKSRTIDAEFEVCSRSPGEGFRPAA